MKKCFLAIIVFLFAMNSALIVFAEQMPEIDSVEKSLSIHFYVQNSGVDIPISGAEIGIYKVADLKCENGSANYYLLSQFESLRKIENGKDVTFDGLSGTESEKLAAEFSNLVTSTNYTGMTDTSGKCTVNNIPQGMYLVMELGAEGEASKYEFFSPYLVSVPLGVKGIDGIIWEYNVISEPKTKIEIETTDNSDESIVPNEDNSPTVYNSNSNASSPTTSEKSIVQQLFDVSKVKTGIVSNIVIYLMILFAAAFVIIRLVDNRKGGSNDEKIEK